MRGGGDGVTMDASVERTRYRYEVRPYPHPPGGWGIWDRVSEAWLDRALDRLDARLTVRDLNDPDFEPKVCAP